MRTHAYTLPEAITIEGQSEACQEDTRAATRDAVWGEGRHCGCGPLDAHSARQEEEVGTRSASAGVTKGSRTTVWGLAPDEGRCARIGDLSAEECDCAVVSHTTSVWDITVTFNLRHYPLLGLCS